MNRRTKSCWRFFGISRSGNHAIIEWFLRNLGEDNTVFMNNCLEGDPFTNFSYCTFVYDGYLRKHRGDIHRKRNRHFDRLMQTAARVEHYVISYEIMPVDDESRSALWRKAALEARLEADFFVLRSPLNLVASLVQRTRNELTRPSRQKAKFERMAQTLAVDYGSYLQLQASDPERVVVYDRWGADAEYRATFLSANGFELRDLSLGQMSSAGGGSSFDTSQDVATISTSKRWPKLKDDPDFLNIVQSIAESDEVMEHIERLFPEDHASLKGLLL